MIQIENYKIIPIGRCKDLSNQQFGDYKVLYRTEVPSTSNSKQAHWLCQCVKCNKYFIKPAFTLTKGTGDSANLDAKFIAPQLDSVSVENIRKYLADARNVITGIPDRQGNSSGGDTGQAVINRDGWTDIEIVARLKELFFKKAKKQQLSVGMKILQKLGIVSKDLSVIDIDLSIGRHTQDNLQTKTQAFATLVKTGELATIDALELSNLTNKTREIVDRGKAEKKERQEEAMKMAQMSANNDNNSVADNDEGTTQE